MFSIMRTLRSASRETATKTSQFFDATNATNARRATRSSLARFAYNPSSIADADDSSSKAGLEDVTLGSDIEDAVTTKVSRKRKRTATSSQSSSSDPSRQAEGRRATTRTAPAMVKTEEDGEETQAQIETEPTSPDGSQNFEPASATKPRGRVRKPARKTVDPATGAVKVEPPTNWEEMYNLVKEMRISGPAANAAVDTMGCERLARADASPRDRRFQTLVALMLSSQTKDTVNAEAMARLHNELPPHKPGAPPGLNLENMLAVDPKLLNELIGKVGFHNLKTKYLKQTAEILRDKFGGDIPPTVETLCSLPGVGPKMAHLCMSATYGWNKVEGIGVDVHVHRITNLWGWNETKTPEDTRKALESWLPRDKWKEINWLLVGFGQTVCGPVKGSRRCGECELGLRGLCKSAERGKVNEGRKRREMEGKVKDEKEVRMEVDKKEEDVEVKEEVTEEVVKKNGAKGRTRSPRRIKTEGE